MIEPRDGQGVMVDISGRELGGTRLGDSVWIGGKVIEVKEADHLLRVNLYADFNGVGEIEVPIDADLVKDASDVLGG